MIDRAHAWLDLARHAPSGDNSQPWRVGLAADGHRLTLTLALDDATRAAPSLFDGGFVASYLSLGAFARNFIGLAATEGCLLTNLREDAGQFTLTFSPSTPPAGTPSPADLAAVIQRRLTNRLPFRKEPLSDDTRAAFARITGGHVGLGLREFTGPLKQNLARLFFALDVARYRNAHLFREFLEKLRFGAEAEQSPDGLRDTTLGAPPPALLFLRFLRRFRHVRAVHALFFLGLERIMAFVGCLALVRSAPSVFVLTAAQDTPLDWFRLGLGFQEIWLEATRQDLALQPLGTTLLVYREKHPTGRQAFTSAEQAVLQKIGGHFQDEFGLDLSQPAIAFRVGRAPALARTSLRRKIAII